MMIAFMMEDVIMTIQEPIRVVTMVIQEPIQVAIMMIQKLTLVVTMMTPEQIMMKDQAESQIIKEEKESNVASGNMLLQK